MATMKKIFFSNFFPTKEEELEAICNPKHYQTPRTLIEVRDDCPPAINPMNPWKVVKRLTLGEIATGKVFLSENDAIEHVFRYWSLEECNQVVMGNKVCVLVYDVTNESKPVVYGPTDENTAFEKGLEDSYVLRLNVSLARGWSQQPGAKISLYWNHIVNAFYLKLFY